MESPVHALEGCEYDNVQEQSDREEEEEEEGKREQGSRSRALYQKYGTNEP